MRRPDRDPMDHMGEYASMKSGGFREVQAKEDGFPAEFISLWNAVGETLGDRGIDTNN